MIPSFECQRNSLLKFQSQKLIKFEICFLWLFIFKMLLFNKIPTSQCTYLTITIPRDSNKQLNFIFTKAFKQRCTSDVISRKSDNIFILDDVFIDSFPYITQCDDGIPRNQFSEQRILISGAAFLDLNDLDNAMEQAKRRKKHLIKTSATHNIIYAV